MDVSAGMQVQRICEERRSNQQQQQTNNNEGKVTTPKVEVHIVRNAGHLLMLDNWEEFNSAMILSREGYDAVLPSSSPRPLTFPTYSSSLQHLSAVQRRKQQQKDNEVAPHNNTDSQRIEAAEVRS